MIQKLKPEINELFGMECPIYNSQALLDTVNQLVDAVNELQKNATVSKMENVEPVENVQPDYVTTTYMTNGHTQEYYGQNGASVVTDHPLPAGYVITIREPETKGGDNE